jgi:uncharacterized protein YndB with AHSA1/START domain
MENKSVSKPRFVYVTYISTTPQKLWNALVDPEMTKQYWARHRNASDWKPGSAWQHQDYDDPSLVDIVGQVVESVPPKRLVLTWAVPADAGNPAKHSRVTFEIEPSLPSFGGGKINATLDAVRLTVTHEELEPDSPMLHDISTGWPAVLSSLKTLLETGQALPWTVLGSRSRPA